MARNYIPCWDKIGISRERYLELLYFCRQYPRWKHEAASMLGIRGKALDGMPHGAGVGDPVAAQAERRERLLRKIDLVEGCARMIGSGDWYSALITNVCHGKPYAMIDPVMMPTSKKASFFKARREFFLALDQMMNGNGNSGGTTHI